MKTWDRLRNALPDWWQRKQQTKQINPEEGEQSNLDLARESLRSLVNDTRVPGEVRQSLAADYRQVQEMLDKL